ncbi:MAG: hypothetical protein ACE5FF_12545 [Saprospiraceae bacterium]
MILTEEKILSLAPDAGTARRAREVAHFRRWHLLEGDGRAVWGEYGNPASPFYVKADLLRLATACTCPVRRKPCKHGIGLLLVFLRNNGVFQVADQPTHVADWIKKRDKRLDKKKAPASPHSKEDEQGLAKTRQKNREKRLFQMGAGLAELENWLTDLFRQGLASLEGQSNDFFQELAARMVDAKLGTLARRIRQLPALAGQDQWHEKMLGELGDIYLLLKGFQNLQHLPEGMQCDLLNLAGMNLKKDDVLANGSSLKDRWIVAGQIETTEEGNLTARRTWLMGEDSRRYCLLLDFAWGGNDFEHTYVAGSVLLGEVAFYPSAYSQRVLFKNFEISNDPISIGGGYASFRAFAKAYAEALSANPWLWPFPALLEHTTPVFQKDTFVLVDAERKQLALLTDPASGWKLLALSGGHPISLFGQWEGTAFRPLSIMVNGQLRPLEVLQDGRIIQ